MMSKLFINVRCHFLFSRLFSSKATDSLYSLEQNLIRPAFKANAISHSISRVELVAMHGTVLEVTAALCNFVETVTAKNSTGCKFLCEPPTLKIPESVLALSLQNDRVSFLHMRSSLEVTRWECKSLFEGQKSRRHDAPHIQEAVYDIVKMLPRAELYLMEDIPLVLGQVSNVSMAISHVRIETTLVTLLNHLSYRHGDGPEAFESRVYWLKPSQISRFFEVYVSGQRTQCSPIAQAIIEGRCEVGKGVYIPFLPAEMFRELENKKSREQMSYCLLQAIFFFKQLERSCGRQSAESPTSAGRKNC